MRFAERWQRSLIGVAKTAGWLTANDAKNTAQGNQQQGAGEDLEAIGAQIITLAGLRREIQITADQAGPWRTPDVKTIRKAFLLPEDRPMPE